MCPLSIRVFLSVGDPCKIVDVPVGFLSHQKKGYPPQQKVTINQTTCGFPGGFPLPGVSMTLQNLEFIHFGDPTSSVPFEHTGVCFCRGCLPNCGFSLWVFFPTKKWEPPANKKVTINQTTCGFPGDFPLPGVSTTLQNLGFIHFGVPIQHPVCPLSIRVFLSVRDPCKIVDVPVGFLSHQKKGYPPPTKVTINTWFSWWFSFTWDLLLTRMKNWLVMTNHCFG